MTPCTACRRTLKKPPIMIGGDPYGPTCAKGATPRPDPLASDLFRGIDIEAAVIRALSRLQMEIEVSAMQHMAAMRASWRARA